MLWRVETRKHLPLFAAIYLITLGLGTARTLLPDLVLLQVLQAVAGLLCWSASTIYAATVMFRYIALRRDLLLHIGTVGVQRITWIKACILFTLLALQHACSLSVTSQQVIGAAAPHPVIAMEYLAVGKLLSIAAFLGLTTAAATTVRAIRGTGSATVLFAVILIAITVLQAILLWRIGAPNTTNFFIGIGGIEYTVHLYAGILPITLSGPAEGYLPSTLIGVSMLLNVGWMLVCGSVPWLPRRTAAARTRVA